MSKSLKSIMSKNIVSVSFGTSVADAKKLMSEKRIRHLAVLDGFEQIVGVVSSKDFHQFVLPGTPVELLMSTPVDFVDEKDTVREVIHRLLEKKISCLMVTNEFNGGIGIITTDDLLWYLKEMLEKEPVPNRVFNVQLIGEIANAFSAIGI